MIKQAFAKNYIPSGGNYKYYKINDPEILDLILRDIKMPVIDAIIEGELLSFVRVIDHSGFEISALRTDNSYNYPMDTSSVTGISNSYISVTGDLIKTLKLSAELLSPSPSKEDWDRIFSMFQEISKEEYESMITK